MGTTSSWPRSTFCLQNPFRANSHDSKERAIALSCGILKGNPSTAPPPFVEGYDLHSAPRGMTRQGLPRGMTKWPIKWPNDFSTADFRSCAFEDAQGSSVYSLGRLSKTGNPNSASDPADSESGHESRTFPRSQMGGGGVTTLPLYFHE